MTGSNHTCIAAYTVTSTRTLNLIQLVVYNHQEKGKSIFTPFSDCIGPFFCSSWSYVSYTSAYLKLHYFVSFRC